VSLQNEEILLQKSNPQSNRIARDRINTDFCQTQITGICCLTIKFPTVNTNGFTLKHKYKSTIKATSLFMDYMNTKNIIK
jgi:hypothetical protein